MTAAELMQAISADLANEIDATQRAFDSGATLLVSRESVASALRTARNIHAYLIGDGRAEVLSGAKTFEAWRELAQQGWELVRQARAVNDRWQWAKVVPEVAGQVVAQVRSDGLDIGRLVVLGLGLMVVLQVLPLLKGARA